MQQFDRDKQSGVLVVDKPSGPTSHDVVNRVRRTLGVREVGHAGTLDPMASGVLVVMVGSCTKLSRFVSLHDKVYQATVQFGVATDTLDAMGQHTERSPVPPWLLHELRHASEALECEQPTTGVAGTRGVAPALDPQIAPRIINALHVEKHRTEQVPPVHSAIKHRGEALYKLARRGEVVQPQSRAVQVMGMQLVDARPERCELVVKLHVSKGYYVRSMARDIAQSLGVPGHLTELRRLQSASWGLDGAVKMDAAASVMRAAMVPLEQVAMRELDVVQLTEPGALRALQGKALSDHDFHAPVPAKVSAWFDPRGRLIAVGDRSKDRPTVIRAFLHALQLC